MGLEDREEEEKNDFNYNDVKQQEQRLSNIDYSKITRYLEFSPCV